jgi:hypothetical protein
MTDRQSFPDESSATYEIRLRGASPEPLRKKFPRATVLTTRTETVLFRRVEKPAELDALIEQLLSMGLVLTEVHELGVPQTSVLDPEWSTRAEETST